ncbi:MAG: alginate export family protein, partial [Proteobacteria bacterium]|nr:alginate export family protein [Pseudomonadota bacterium]
MKRLLLSVFAAAITAAMVLPVAATASDITFSGSYKLRGESTSHSDFTKTASEKNVWHQRTRLTANAAATDDASVKVTIQDTRDWGGTTLFKGGNNLTESGDNVLDVHEASLTVNNLLGTGADLTVGRQEINLGDQRLIGAFGWNEKGHSFDAARIDYAVGDSADLLLVSSKLVEGDSATDDDVDMY